MQMLNSEQRKRLAIPSLGAGPGAARFDGALGEGDIQSGSFSRTEGGSRLAGLTLPTGCCLPARSAAFTGSTATSALAAGSASPPARPSSAGSSSGGFTGSGAMNVFFALPAIPAASARPAPQRSAPQRSAPQCPTTLGDPVRLVPASGAVRAMAAPPAGQALAKRVFDLCFALAFLAVALPFIILLAAALQVSSPGPVFFVQQRVGRRGAMFGCIKLRTMRRDADAALAQLLATCADSRREWEADHKLRRDPRVSPLGRVVRKLSLDELPQLINILRGEMSVVGPRPIVAAEIPRYGAAFADYCEVKPGLTGLWQVSGRNDTTYVRRVELDSDYARRANFWFDCGIVLRTVPAVVLGRGCY